MLPPETTATTLWPGSNCTFSERSAAVDAAARRVLVRHPKLDLLVNNAGMPARGSFLTAKPERIEEVVNVNYLGSVWATLAFLPGLDKGAHIGTVVSVAGSVAGGQSSGAKPAQLGAPGPVRSGRETGAGA